MPPIKIGNKSAYLLSGFLTEEQCNEMIKKAEDNGWLPALVNGRDGQATTSPTVSSTQVYDPDLRKCNRAMVLDQDFADKMFDYIKFAVPTYKNLSKEIQVAKGLNPMFRYLKYEPGEYFKQHYDGTYTDENDNKSRITVQIYLNEGFKGGETIFYGPKRDEIMSYYGRYEDDPVEVYRHVPKRGDILLFDQRILHEGAEVKSGIKMCVRTEVMY